MGKQEDKVRLAEETMKLVASFLADTVHDKLRFSRDLTRGEVEEEVLTRLAKHYGFDLELRHGRAEAV